MWSTILGISTVLAVLWVIPVVVGEKIVWSYRKTVAGSERRDETESIKGRLSLAVVRLAALVAGFIYAGAWMLWVFHIQKLGVFGVPEVLGAAMSGVLLVAGLTFWVIRSGVPAMLTIPLVSLYLSIGVTAGYAASAGPADVTGLWAVGAVMMAACSMGLAIVLTSVFSALASRK